jgi:hypothetical protein
MKVIISLREALADAAILGDAMSGPSWDGWRTILLACAGEELTDTERETYKRLTGRDQEPGHMVDLFLGVVGRRAGKTKAMSIFMTWLACCCDWTENLSIGERGIALIVAPTERQATVTSDYIRGIIDSSPLLSSLVEEKTQAVLKLKRQVGIEILPANVRFVRGITAIGIALDESAYLPSNEDSVNSDISLLEALRPSVASTGGPVLITSSPATMQGIVYNLWKRHYGPDGSGDVIVVQADTRSLNPKIKQSVIDKAFETDAAAAATEFGGQFREPLSAFITRAMVEGLVEKGCHERRPQKGVEYRCFVDIASGSGTDSTAMCIGHRATDEDRDVIVIDYLRQSKPPFNPHEIIAGIAGILQNWGIRQVTGDNYAGNFVPASFAKHGIAYHPAKLSASELYIAALPAFTSGSLALLDQADVVTQLVNLRRKIGSAGKETVLHMRGQHDDLANALCGLIHICTPAVFNLVNVAELQGIGVVSEPRIHFGDPGSGDSATDIYMRQQRGIYGKSRMDGGPIKNSPRVGGLAW